ncbi:MAG: hypothetical protein WCP46_00325 [Alphaproteobacteria bacterium]
MQEIISVNPIYGDFTLTAQGSDISFNLSVGYDPYKDIYYMPSLSFIKEKGMVSLEEYLEIWDNEDYIIETLLNKVLVPWIDTNEILDSKEFAELINIDSFNMKDFKLLRELIEKGMKLGFFEEYEKRKLL